MSPIHWRHVRGRWVAVLTAGLMAACNSPERTSPNPPLARESIIPEPPSSSPATTFEQELEFCVAETNRYRATIGLSPLTRSRALEAYAAAGARQDGLAHKPHLHYKSAKLAAKGIAENELPWWPGPSVRSVIEKGIATMWAEGPKGGHYENIRGPYSQLGCGVFVNGTEITVVQDFQ
jgi:uncharacterized protein YkwD